LVHRLLTDIRKDTSTKKDFLVREIESALFPKGKPPRRRVKRKSNIKKLPARKTQGEKSAPRRRR